MQGEQAPKELLNAFLEAQKYDLDTLIIGRGGGASEDLSAFNDEKLVRAIANSKMPVIAAVGHEIDSTLVDFVADKRASTPTGAAELATVDRREIESTLDYASLAMEQALFKNLKDKKEEIDSLKEEMDELIKDKVQDLRKHLDNLSTQINLLKPDNILKRGYSISYTKDGKIIKNVKDVKVGEVIITTLANGSLSSEVTEAKEK